MKSRGRIVAGSIAFVLAVACASSAIAAEVTQFVHTIYLVRHGAYVPDPKADPETGPGLTPLGIAQARLIAARLRGMPVQFDAITSSTLTRAKQTAASVHEALPAVPLTASPLLAECTPPGQGIKGESEATQSACKQRLDSAFASLLSVPASGADKNDVLVCHGNVIRYLVTKALGGDTRNWPALSVAHASLTIIQIRADGAMRVMAVGDSGHIPPNLLSWGSDADPQLVVK